MRTWLVWAALCAAMIGIPHTAFAKVKDLPPVADAQVAEGAPTTNYGSSTNFFVQSATPPNSFLNERGWLRFDLAGELPPGATLSSAKLRIYNFDADEEDDLFAEVLGVSDDSWDESTITWNTQPSIAGASPLGTTTFESAKEFLWYEVDVTAFVQTELSGDGVVSFVVKPVTESQNQWRSFRFNTRDFGTNLAPRLRLEFTGDWPAAGGYKVIHFNDLHSRLTTHDLDLPAVDDQTGFEEVGGAAYVASKVIELKTANPDALVLDAGDISEGNPLGDLRGNGGTVDYLDTLDAELKALGGRGIDAIVVGNHDVRDISMVNNMAAATVPYISVNILPDGTPTPYTTATPTYFPAYVTVQAGPVKVGVLGYSTDDSTYLGANTENVLDVAETVWSDSDPTTVDLKDWVDYLRTVENCDSVVLLSHIGHRRLNATDEALLGDTGDVRPPDLVVSGHWHTWTESAWQPSNLNYRTTNVEAASYGQYVGEVTLSAEGRYVSSVKHPIRVADITPNAAVQTLIGTLETEYNAGAPTYALNQVIGHSAVDLTLDKDKWWTLSEFPWSGDNTAGEWVSDSMVWQANQLGQNADLGIQSGGGIRRDVQAGPVTYLEIYETYPWQDDEMVRIQMTGQQIWDYIEGRFVGSSISEGWVVTANDGIISGITVNGSPINLVGTYDVVISEFMYENEDWISETGSTFTFQMADPTPEFLGIRIRDSVIAYTAQFGVGNPMTIAGPRYILDTEFAGGFEAVVTMTNDAETQPYFEGVFIRLLNATPETTARRNSYGLSGLVNADGSINADHQFAETMLYRSHLGFLDGYLQVGDIIEVWGEGGFFSGNPQFVDQEGIVESETEYRILGNDPSLALPEFMQDSTDFFDEFHENHLVEVYVERTGDDTVRDSADQEFTVYQPGGFFTTRRLPGVNGDVLKLVGTQTERHPDRRFRLREATVETGYPPSSQIQAPGPMQVGQVTTLTSIATDVNGPATSSTVLGPIHDAQVEEGNPNDNNATFTALYVQSASAAASSFGNERAWLQFDLSGIPGGATIDQATLELYQWRFGQPASQPTSVHHGLSDAWTEFSITWANQPGFGGALDTQTLTPGTTDWYGWDVTSQVTTELAGDGTLSLVVKPVAEDNNPALTYAFESKEWSDASLRPRLVIDTSGGSGNQGTIASVEFFYRFSADGSSWGAWASLGQGTEGGTNDVWTADFVPGSAGFYEFYSVATDSDLPALVEPAPIVADAPVEVAGLPSVPALPPAGVAILLALLGGLGALRARARR